MIGAATTRATCDRMLPLARMATARPVPRVGMSRLNLRTPRITTRSGHPAEGYAHRILTTSRRAGHSFAAAALGALLLQRPAREQRLYHGLRDVPDRCLRIAP